MRRYEVDRYLELRVTLTGAQSQGFVHLGGGLAYSIGKSGLAVFVQGDAFSYSLSEMTSPTFGGFSKIQVDLGWGVGASYRLPL